MMTFRRLMSLVTALVMLMCIPLAQAEMVGVIVRSAPLTRSDAPLDGMVRIYLSSLGSPSTLDVTVVGSYSVDGNASLSLTSGQSVKISFNSGNGQITMTTGGKSYAMGQEMALRRHQASGESGFKIAQAKRPNNLYTGDLQLVARSSGSGYKLYTIVHVYIEYYLYGVVPNEMSSSWPIEALKAQAVAARTYTLNRMNGRTSYIYDLVDTASDQVYYGYSGTLNNAITAVDQTKGIVIMNNGKLSGTYYTASNGGQTEAVKNIWGGTGYPYLGVKDDPFDAMNPNTNKRKRTVYSDFNASGQNSSLKSLLTSAARSKLGSSASVVTIDSITPHTPKYPAPSRLYTKMDFMLTAVVGSYTQSITVTLGIFDELETAMNMSINSSNNELWTVTKDGNNFVLMSARYGHGVGLSQRGAQQMANMGYTYDQILGFYYDGCTRMQHTFTHTILPSIGSGGDAIVTTEAPATIVPALNTQAVVQLVGSGESLPVRYTASSNGKVLLTIPNGSVVVVLSQGASWTLINYGQINGYVPTNSLVFTGEPPTASTEVPTNITQWGTVTADTSLNLRQGPGYDYDVIGSIPEGGIVCVLSTSGSWVKVQYGQHVGYCHNSYLTLSSSYPADVTITGTSAMVNLAGGIGSAPLYATASTAGTILLYVAHGTQVTVMSNDGSWCRVSVSGVEGYMLKSALDFSATGVSPTSIPMDPDDMYAIVDSDASTLNLREGPSQAYDVIAEIPKGTLIIVTSYGADWCAVRWGDLTGYVMTEYLSFDVDVPTSSPATATPAPAETDVPSGTLAIMQYNADLRVAESTSSEILLLIPSGETVTIISYDATWCRISYSGLTGYVQTSTLRIYEEVQTTAPATATPTPTPTATPTPTPTPVPSFEPVHYNAVVVLDSDLLSSPDTGSELLMTVPAGAEVTVSALGTSWSQISYNGVSGWMITSQLYIDTESTPEPTATPTPTPTTEPTATPTAAPEETEEPENAITEEIFSGDAKIGWIVLTVESVSMYEEADKASDVINEVERGTQLTVLEKRFSMSRVYYEGQIGYIYNKYIVYEEPVEIVGYRYINTDVDPLALRDAPTTSGSKVLTRIPRGTRITLIEDLGDWGYVKYGDMKGYCAMRYLSADKPTQYATRTDRILDVTLTAVTGWKATINPNEEGTIFLREWCATDAPTVCEVASGEQVTLIKKGIIWCLISYEGEEGYCLTRQLHLIEPTT